MTRHKMKGFENNILTAFLLISIVIAFIGFIDAVPLFNDKTERLTINRDTYSMKNSLDWARQYAELSLEYAAYQACYDVLKSGGYDQIPQGKSAQDLALWYDNGNTPPIMETFLGSLASKTSAYMQSYTSGDFEYLEKNFLIKFPDYAISYSFQPGSFSVEAKSPKGIAAVREDLIGEGYSISIEKAPGMAVSLDTSCGDFFWEEGGLGRQVSGQVERIIGEESNKYAKEGSYVIEGTAGFSGDQREMASLVLQKEHGMDIQQLEAGMEGDIRSKVEGMFPDGGEGRKKSIEILELKATVEPECTGNTVVDNEDTQVDIACSRISYRTSALLKVAVEDFPENTVPVDTGKNVEFAPLKLVFGVRYDRAIGEQVEFSELAGDYLLEMDVGEEFLIDVQTVAFRQEGETLEWAVPWQGGFSRGQGSVRFGAVELKWLPFIFSDITGKQHPFLMDFSGIVEGGEVSGEVSGVSILDGTSIEGTFTASLSQA